MKFHFCVNERAGTILAIFNWKTPLISLVLQACMPKGEDIGFTTHNQQLCVLQLFVYFLALLDTSYIQSFSEPQFPIICDYRCVYCIAVPKSCLSTSVLGWALSMVLLRLPQHAKSQSSLYFRVYVLYVCQIHCSDQCYIDIKDMSFMSTCLYHIGLHP